MNILFINNYDSFVYNLVNYFCQLAPDASIIIEDNNIPIEKVKEYFADKIIISPGPGHPKYDTGTVIPIIKEYYKEIPILGICLGHQAIVETFGKKSDLEYIGRAKVGPMHGKVSKIFHDQETIFKNIPNPLMVIRYHSLAVKSDLLPQELKITATADDGTIMAVRHKNYPVEGVQFHPESIKMKPYGIKILKNFLEL
ncbi:MAG: aminodeoxychorismate/anthranilate synthase component II [Methanomassiliicoccales archaeon]|nr:MAG: aminodeoxychorismate/anthranilate synthase component II [Methanomassiliicoccales archaeon]